MVLGTAAYMSPEQVRGEQIDHRSDIFSFGSILHEMITGKRAFHRQTMAETMAAILKEEPEELAQTSPNVSPTLSGIVERCLEKRPDNRFQSTNDLVFALENISTTSGISRQIDPRSTVSSYSKPRLRSFAATVVLLLIACVVSAFAAWYLLGNSQDPHKGMILSIGPPEGSEFLPVAGIASVSLISPDGRSVLFRTDSGLYVRTLNSTELIKVPGSESAANQPVWRDSSTVTFPTFERGWKSVRIPDGAPEPVADRVSWTRGGAWSKSGRFIYSASDKLWTPGGDGKSVEIKNPTGREGMLMYPEFVGDSDDFLVHFLPDDNAPGEIWLATLSDSEMKDVSVLFQNETQALYTPYAGGHILFVRNDNLYSQEFDHSSRSVVGEPELIVQRVASQEASDNSRADFSVSDNGVIAWRTGKLASSRITVFDREGEVVSTAGPDAAFSSITLSPADDTRLLIDLERAGYGLIEVGQSGVSELPRKTEWFGWSDDGASVVGIRDEKVVSRNVADGVEKEIGSTPPGLRWAKAISPDGNLLLHFCESIGPICVSQLGEDGKYGNTTPLINGKNEFHAISSFSPDGKYVLYRTQGSGTGIYVQQFPGSGRRTLISDDPGTPVWRGDGKEILYSHNDAVWSVEVSGSGDNLSFSQPKKLFSGLRYPANTIGQSVFIQVSNDGSKIFWTQAAEQPDDGLINVLFGF
jgi:hypothetical protein